MKKNSVHHCKERVTFRSVLRDVGLWGLHVRSNVIPVERKRKNDVYVKGDDEGKKEERNRFG
jgi:hypothetical protein